MYIVTSAVSGVLGLIFLVIWALLLIFTLLNILRNPGLNLDNKIWWIVIVLVVPIIGSLVYIYWKSVNNP